MEQYFSFVYSNRGCFTLLNNVYVFNGTFPSCMVLGAPSFCCSIAIERKFIYYKPYEPPNAIATWVYGYFSGAWVRVLLCTHHTLLVRSRFIIVFPMGTCSASFESVMCYANVLFYRSTLLGAHALASFPRICIYLCECRLI